MNELLAKEILGIKEDFFTLDLCKKKYRMLALKYHPDKNSSQDATNKFIHVNEAYEYLSQCKERSEVDYKSLFLSFINNIWGADQMLGQNHETLYSIFMKLSSLCTIANDTPLIKSSLKKMIEPIDKDILIKIWLMVTKYKDVFHISEFLSDVIMNIIQEKNENCICLYPYIDDLFEEKLYKLVDEEQTYIVPLWHHELIYDGNLCVKCCPVLRDNVRIDCNNNILISLHYTIQEIFHMKTISFELGERTFSFDTNLLRIKKVQVHRMKGCGIPRINSENIFDVSRKGDILVSIFIED